MSDDSARNALKPILKEMRKRAAKMGPQHAWWDVILDVEAFLNGRPASVDKTAHEWLVYCRNLLKERPPKESA